MEGANGAIWASEVRVTNFSSAPKAFRIVDWIGTPGWIPSAYSIPAGATQSVIDNGSGFFPAGTSILLPWLHTDPKRRVNLSLVNPDAVAADITLSLFPADGTSPVVSHFTVPARTVWQINGIFSPTSFGTVRARNDVLKAAAARATIVSTTRLYPLAYVISNQNNTVTISLPR